jgi:aspartyl protease family protein
MLRLAAIAVIGAVSAGASTEALLALAQNHMSAAQHAQAASAASAPASSADEAAAAEIAPATGQAAEVEKGPDGHFWAEGSVNGEAVHFLVDTGASAVALTPTDAQRLGFDPATLSYTFNVTTASGQARAAHVKLASVSVAGAEVDDVDAYVIDSGLKDSLLGMSYLGRLSQFEATQNSLVLRP